MQFYSRNRRFVSSLMLGPGLMLLLAAPGLGLPGLEQVCSDGLDNDSDGLVDAGDPDCSFEYLCQDGLDNDLDLLIDTSDPDCTCLDDITGFNGAGCTANDLEIVLVGLGVQSDGCVNAGDLMTILLGTQLEGRGGNTRYDVDMWIPLDGGDARTGQCVRQTLTPNIAPTGTIPTSAQLTNGCGPYREDDGDGCSEVRGSDDPCLAVPTPSRCPSATSTIDAIYDYPFVITLPCTPTAGGFLQLATCVSWDNNANTTCNGPAEGLPGTQAKCRCEPETPTDVPVPNLGMSCGCAPNPVDPGSTATCTVTYTNSLPALVGDPCVSDATVAERFRCATASHLRFKVDYDDTLGSVSNVTSTRGTRVLEDTDAQNGDDRIVWTPASALASAGIVAANETDTLSFDFNVDAGAPLNTVISIDTTTFWSDDTIFAAEVEQTALTCNLDIASTPVTLAEARARSVGDTTVVEWATATETGNVGFNVYIETEAGWWKVNEELIPSNVVDSTAPQRYSLSIPGESPRFYAVEDVAIDGSTRSHGPFAVASEHGREPEPVPIDWQAIRDEHRASALARLPGAKARPAARSEIQLLIDESGLYRVRYEDLLAAGIELHGAPVGNLAVLHRGMPVPIRVEGRGTFGPGDFLEIYAEGIQSLYTTSDVYQLKVDRRSARRISTDDSVPRGTAAAAYLETRTFANERIYSFGSPTADPWYDTALLAFGQSRQWSFPFTIDGHVAGAGLASLSVDVWGSTVWPRDPDHHLKVSLNGSELVDETFDGRVAHTATVALPVDLLVEGANALTLDLPADLGVQFDLINLDGFSVTYPRHFRAVGDELRFQASGEVFVVDGLSSADVVAYRLLASGPQRLTAAEVSADAGAYRVRLPGASMTAQYVVVAAESIRTPRLVSVSSSEDIATGDAQYLVIAHPDFLGSLDPLITLRESDGLQVRTVDVEAIYRRFNYGIVDPSAIRDYIAHAAKSMGTRYVLLVGGDTYDYRDDLGIGSMSFIPTLYTETGSLITFSPVDPLYTDLDGDLVPDLPIGRLPVRTVSELETVIEKIVDYETKSYARASVFAADRLDGRVGFSFAQQSEAAVSQLPPEWSVERAYIDTLGTDEARNRLLQAIDAGMALTTFIGHSGPTSWSFDGLLRSADVATLGNDGRPTVVMQWGCWNTYHVEPRFDTMGHAFLVSGDRGAAAVMGSSTLLETVPARALSDLLLPRLTVPGMRLGDAITAAKRALARSHPDLLDVMLGWTLLGDPAMTID